MNKELHTSGISAMSPSASVMTPKPSISIAVVLRLLQKRILTSSLVQGIALVFSAIMEEEITAAQSLKLLHSMLALFTVVFPIDMPLPLRFLLIGWFIVTLLQCRQAGLDKD